MLNVRSTHAVIAIVLAVAAPLAVDAQSKASANASVNASANTPAKAPAVGRAEIGWLALYTSRLANLTYSGSVQPLRETATLRTGPSREAPSAGTLVMTSSPGEGFRVAYLPENGSTPIDFSPDLTNGNCGQFHHSYRERRGDWFLLREGPLPHQAWVDWNDLAGETGHQPLQRDDIVEGPWGNITILGVGVSFVRFRAEQDRDMWLEDEPQPPVAPFRERRVPISQLFTSTGQIRVTPRYPCGC